MGSLLTLDEMPLMGDPQRVAVREYPGGHMFYTRPGSQSLFMKDVEAMVAARWFVLVRCHHGNLSKPLITLSKTSTLKEAAAFSAAVRPVA